MQHQTRVMKSEMNKLQIHPMLQGLALIAMFAACAGQTAMAEEIKVFEWRNSNGVTSYSQTPPPPGTQGVTSHEINTQTLTPAQRAAIKAYLAHIGAAARADSARYRAELAAADQDVSAALRSLSEAERAARDGRTPLASERIGIAGGGSRLQAEYFERQKLLEEAIQDARVKVDEAYRLRSQIMP